MKDDRKYICTPMNYIGGKYRLLPQLLPMFPHRIRTFADLFCGGCNVGVNVRAEKVVFNDNLTHLISLYNSFKKCSVEEVMQYVNSRIEEYQLTLTNEDGYKSLRMRYNSDKEPLDLFVLIAYSFNHQIRFNNSQEFNAPFGRNRSMYNPKMENNLRTFLEVIHERDFEFVSNNFDQFSFEEYENQDFVYCDPPYLISVGTYNDGRRGFTGWGEKEERGLLNVLSELDGRNVKFGLSNVLTHKENRNEILTQWVEEKKFNVYHLRKDYSNASYHTLNRDKSSTDEVYICNYNPFE